MSAEVCLKAVRKRVVSKIRLRRIIRHFYDGKSEVLVVMTGLFVTVGDVTKRSEFADGL